jgi:predicted RND superfamily exporter protein
VVFCIVFGIAVDDTIHFLSALHSRRHLPWAERVRSAVHETGAALVGTTVILVGGFSVLLFSGILANRIFGSLCAATLVLALLADLLVLPALILLLGARGSSPAPWGQ